MTDRRPVPARRCAGTTKKGDPCRSPVVGVDGFCPLHRPGADPAALGRAGGVVSGEVRRDQAKSVRQRLAERLQENADEIYDSFRQAWREGDWRAADAAINQALGRPPIVGDPDQPIAFQVISAFAQAAAEREEKTS